MTDTTDIKALRTLSMQRVKEIANGDSMLMGERVDLANTAIRFHKELDVALDAFKNAATELFSVQEQLEAERQRADEEFILIGYAEDGKGFVYEPRHQDRISNPIAIYRSKES